MHRHLITFIAFAVSLTCFKEINAQQPNVEIPAGLTKITTVEGISEYQLTNGLRLLLAPDNSLDSITVNVVYLVGSRDEGYGEAGMAHLLEHLLFKGTEQFSDIKNEFTKRGARWNGTTSYDRTNYFETFTASADNLDWALRLEADRMVNSRVAKSDLDSEMTVVRNEFEAGENSSFSVLSDRITSAAYSWHNYGRSIIGSRSDIENVPIERLQAFYRHYYQPDNAVLVIAGKFEEAEALKMVARHFGPLPRPTRQLQKTYTVEPTQDGERMVKLRRVGDTQIAATLYHLPSGAHPEYAAIDLLVTILREVPGGRLHKALVEPKHASTILGFDRQLREAGYAFFSANLRPDMPLDTARDVLIDTVESLTEYPITAEELERARTRLLNEIEQLLADTRKLSITLTEFIAMGDWRLLFLHRDRIKQASLDEVQRAANSYFKPSNRTLGLFIPTSAPDRAEIPATPNIARMLEGYRGDPSVSTGEAFDPTPANIEARIIRTTLPGGMKLAMVPKKTRGSTVVASLILHWGDEESTQNRSTACNIASSMLMRGTKHHTREALRDALDKLKAQVKVDIEGVSIETVRANLPNTLRLVAEVLREPTFPEKEFEQLKLAMLSSIESKRSEPSAQASLVIERHLAPYPASHWHYTPTLEERIARINALTLDEVKQCHSELFGASESEFSIVGDFEPEEVAQLLQQLFSDWNNPHPYKRIPVLYQDITPINHDIETPDKANAVFQAGMNLKLRDNHPDYPALIIGNYLLGGSADSRLWRRIREQEGLSYNVASSLSASAFEEQGEFSIYAIYAPENRARIESAMKEELERIMKDGFTKEEVETAKAGYLQARRIARGQDKALAERLANYLTRKRTMQWDIEFETNIAALTPESILAALRNHLDFNKLTIIKAGDFSKITTATASQ
ncbi:M16 family metallopeptidase [Nitrosomonas communis]|uniref:M16 family metallopeptidase n=1 Tax=Nitrosomonas communis TaxID=44574 RepID=UPI003D2B5AAC